MGNSSVCTRVLVVVTDLEAILSVEVGTEIVEAMYIIGLKMNGLVFTFSRVVMLAEIFFFFIFYFFIFLFFGFFIYDIYFIIFT